ncbi:MAG: dihydroorotate dehydrogenase electron transfer subunit [Muribaculaceae bacterium]|nr:dihydroorotate dehydrogenase electron transfer subunit [Muribaculaceae bacterium]
MKKNFSILSNERVAQKTWRMVLKGDTSHFDTPGQFANIAIEGKYLRRPISVCDYNEETLTLLYDVVGSGTAAMSEMQPGKVLDILTGLGNGFNVEEKCIRPVLIGGGIGVAPLLNLAKALRSAGKEPTVVLGFNTSADVVLEKEFNDLGIKTIVTTADGSYGIKGFVTDALRGEDMVYDYFYACGPLPMMRALCNELPIDGQLSLDERMACGFGICMCCSLETRNGAKRICKDGPVFLKNELIWK